MSKEDKQAGILRPRDQRRIDQDPERRSKSKKNTKRWCKGKVGREHVPEIRFNEMWRSLDRKCGARVRFWGGGCYHEEACSGCGKILRWALPWGECPDNPRNRPNG